MIEWLQPDAIARWAAKNHWLPESIRLQASAKLEEMDKVKQMAAHVAEQLAYAEKDRESGYPGLRWRFQKKVGYAPDFDNPRTHNEKINWRKLHDRHPFYIRLTDKLRVRDYVAEVLGRDAARALFPRLLGVSEKPTARWLRRFGGGIAIKANNGCGKNIFVMPNERADWESIAQTARLWMHQKHGILSQEWAYWEIPPRVMVEELLITPEGRCADDVKFSMFDGVCGFLQFEHDRFGRPGQGFFRPDGAEIDMKIRAGTVKSPRWNRKNFDAMMSIAEKLSAAFDYIRVDFLVAGDRFALNELTLYRGSGLSPFNPVEYDFEFGDMWTLRPWGSGK